MVRETRHLWVGNLPDNIREDRIKDHFKRYGRVQNVKLLGRTESASAGPSASASVGASSGVCATVAFMDIKSASKAHNAEHVLDERTLTTEYYEPAAIPSAAGAPSAGSSPAGSGYSGSSSSVNSAPTLASVSASAAAAASASVARYHLSGGEEAATPTCAIAATAAAPANWRGTNDSATEYCRRGSTPAAYGRYQRNNSTAPYATPPSNVERTPHHRWYASGERGATGGESTPSTPGGGTESGRRRRSGSGSSRSESSSPEPSDASRASTPAGGPAASAPTHHAAARSTPPTQLHHQWSSTASGRPLAICVRNLPTRSTDSSLKDGLYHEYKKHGKVVWVKVVGQNADRYAVVRFKKPSDVEKALEVSQDKLFFGCKISVAPHQSCDEDADSAKPYETDIDEYHPKATRTLFIGNLEKDVTQQQLRDMFKRFGRIIEIDIKKGSGGGAGYAFCQYASISSVVDAIRAMDGEYVGSSRVKLGFGKPVATTCVWVDGLTEHTEKQVLSAVARCGAATSVCVDRAAGAALVHFEQASAAGACVRELRRVAALVCAAEPDRHRLAVDYASRECQEAFYEQLEKHGGSAALSASERLSGGDLTPRYIPSTRHEQLSRFEGTGSRSRASSYGRASSRTPRYSSLEHYDPADYAADRRYRVYDELGSSPQADEIPYEDRLQSVVVSPHRSRRHRRDSSPEDRKHSKERHRSGGATCSSRRSRSGSRGCTAIPAERHSARRRHRRRRDGTPLRDEPLPCEPRRPPPPRPALPMCLPLPKFAAQLLRSAAPTPRPPPPAPAPASPPRAPSASSSSAGSAPHSPSLEERIRSLDEKYEKWSGSRALQEAPDRARLRHRLLEVDINEVKPSEVVRSLLAKRSVFDEDSERLEGAVRAPSPGGSPHARLLCSTPSTPATPATPSTPSTPRALRYPFPVHPLPSSSSGIAPAPESELEAAERPSDPRLNRPERTYLPERLGKINESDYRLDSRIRLRTPSTDKPADSSDKRTSPKNDRERVETERDHRKENIERRRLEFLYGGKDSEVKASFEAEEKEVKEAIEKIDPDFQNKEKSTFETSAVESNKKEETQRIKTENVSNDEINCLSQPLFSQECLKTEVKKEKEPSPVIASSKEPSPAIASSVKCEGMKSDIPRFSPTTSIDEENNLSSSNLKTENEKVCKDVLVPNHINKEIEFDTHLSNLTALNAIKSSKDVCDLSQEFIKNQEKNGKERYNQNVILEAFHTKLEKENIEYDRSSHKDACEVDIKILEVNKNIEDRHKSDRDRTRHIKEKIEKDRHDEKTKNSKSEKVSEKCDREKKSRDDISNESLHHDKPEKVKMVKDTEKTQKEKHERDCEKSIHSEEKSKHHSEEKSKHLEEKLTRHDHHRKDKCDKDKRKDSGEIETSKAKKEEKHKNERRKDSTEPKRDSKRDADSAKSRKSSRDETSKDLNRKDSTDSSTSKTSHDSSKIKDVEHIDTKEDSKNKSKSVADFLVKQEHEKDSLLKSGEFVKSESFVKIKTENKEEKDVDTHLKDKDTAIEPSFRCKSEISEKQRHYSLDSPGVDSKRKERLNSCSSLPPTIGFKRRMSSQDSIDSLLEDVKKSKTESKAPERRDSKDAKIVEKHKTTKFNKGHFAKIIESKTKDEKKNQVKPPDVLDSKDIDPKDKKLVKKSPNGEEEKTNMQCGTQPERLQQHDLDFLATLELRSSEEDEMQKALRKEMKEKKRIQQLQQIQQLQMQQDALHQAELIGKLKDEKKQKSDEKRKESAREKRMSTDRKSRDDKSDSNKSRCNKGRKNLSTDSSDSDGPKKQHSIFDIIDDEPTYISMYDKVKARSCKNMQKQEEEKRQEKIKAKFCQLKQSRAKREEKKRSSWDEDSDSEHERRKSNKTSMDSSSEEERIVIYNKKREKSHGSSFDYDRSKINDYFSMPSTEEDSRNKLSRKNSRTRIISDTSDDEISKRNKSPSYFGEMRKEFLTNFESLQRIKDGGIFSNDSADKVKKNSLLNLFGKSDSDDSKLKSSLESNDSKSSYMKLLCNDFSSESESMVSNRNIGIRKKHKKKQKKHKISISDDDIRINDIANMENELKHKNAEKIRRHSNKKEKRKEKIRASVDVEESRDEKVKPKKEKKVLTSSFDLGLETISNKKDGKMEDIFGPLSDDSERDLDLSNNKMENVTGYTPIFSASNEQLNVTTNSDELKVKDENKRKKEKRKKERRLFSKDDDNSLDVDAVGKAIEARLFADSITDDDCCVKMESLSDYVSKNQENDHNYGDINLSYSTAKIGDRHDKRESKEKKKKKKRSKGERQNRKEHHHLNNEKIDKQEYPSEKEISQLSQKTMLLNIPLPNDTQTDNIKTMQAEDRNSLSESPSLPRLTESPPAMTSNIENNNSKRDSATEKSHEQTTEFVDNNIIEINDIPMPPPFEDVPQQADVSDVPLPEETVPSAKSSPEQLTESFESSFSKDVKSESAVHNNIISNLEKDTDTEKAADKVVNESQSCKVDKKVDEKPRAIISQEETEDAVAALLGESFGGKVDAFANCYDETDNSSTHKDEIESTATGTEIIPEEDAEEMRQAVQNLNASEMEMKPDTPVSDNDLLLIDTDTEENDDTPQETIERLATSDSVNVSSDKSKATEETIAVPPKLNPLPQPVTLKECPVKISEAAIKVQATKPESQQITSTATPVITSWTLTSNKLIEPNLLNIQSNHLPREASESKTTHITANIVQIKAPQNQTIATSLRPIITPNRVSAPYQVINQIIRPQVQNMQPPTIKIPEPHILYQKQSGIVISPRMANDPRLQSPKASPQGESISSPCLTNMAILSTSPQSLNSVGIASANTVQQRSPGQVTVVRMQQPPLSPIQAMHLPHGARTMVSPNRPNSVLVQTQGSPLHFNRLPVTPVLAPLSKQMNINNMIQHKGIGVSNPPLTHQQKVMPGDARKTEHRNMFEPSNDTSKIILSPTNLQHSTNPTVMAQNRLISMQNSIHSGSINSAVHLTNKVLIGNVNHLSDKNKIKKSEQSNQIPFGSTPIIHVAGVNHSTASIIHSGSKSVMCSVQEHTSVSRNQSANVIHALNSQRLLTTAPISNVIQLETSNGNPSVLTMATIRSPTVLTKRESSNTVSATTNSITNVVMTPLSVKPSSTAGTIRLNPKDDLSKREVHQTKIHSPLPYNKLDDVSERQDVPKTLSDASDKEENNQFKPVVTPETDFEELLKDTTNEIKISNDPEKKLEINVGKTITTITTNMLRNERKNSIETSEKQDKKDKSDLQNIANFTVTENKDNFVSKNDDLQVRNSIFDNTSTVKAEKIDTAEKVLVNDKDSKEAVLDTTSDENKPPMEVKPFSQDPVFHDPLSDQCDNSESLIKNEDNDPWSSKDLNIESVIKKVDSLCNDSADIDKKNDKLENEPMNTDSASLKSSPEDTLNVMDTSTNTNTVTNSSEDSLTEKPTSVTKRGGRNVRGKKSDRVQDRVQTRQISKTPRGATSAKRGRGGRAKVDKKIKSIVNSNLNNIPGDVYDFHEDSGDESSTSANKSESRPRLILTIKSPLSGQTNAIATSTLSITPKEQPKNADKSVKDEKPEDFVSPLNTRKSRRLLEKDVQRSTVDDVIEDVVKGGAHNKGAKDANNKKKQTRQVGAKANQQDKGSGSDTRKSPRGVKRTRDRSLSDASVDSSDEKIHKKEDLPKDSKVPKLAEPLTQTKTEANTSRAATCSLAINPPVAPVSSHPPVVVSTTAVVSVPTAAVAPVPTAVVTPAPTAVVTPAPTAVVAPAPMAVVTSAPTAVVAPAPVTAPTPTPIMKPPKKMISEISAKLASAFEAAASTPVHPQAQAERIPMEIDKAAPPLLREPRKPDLASAAPASEAIVAATGDARASAMGVGCAGEAGGASGTSGERARRRDALSGGAEASDARVQSPALPHRLPERADRATPLLIRGAVEAREGEAAGAGGAGGAGVARRYVGTASLPRGAHLPPPSHLAPQPHLPHLPHHPHGKQVAVVGPHHHHPGAASRVTITSVPTISPQGQIAMGEGMYPHFSQQHYQMYQQHFRATQHEARATPSPYTRTLEAEGCEAPTPPLELRRPPSARVPRPAHSPAPNDRLILYAAGCGRSPPPAHGTSRLPGALPPAPPGPPHASQVPREADSLQMLLRRYPVMWQGLLALKNDSAAVQMHFVGGNPAVAGDTLPRHTDGSTPPLRIAQRMRLEPAQLDQVHRKMKLENEHCILLALPCGRDHMDVLQQSTNLTGGFITYLQRKQAAGIVNVAPPGHHQAMYTVHIFPSCDFANENLSRIAPDLMHRVADIAHLLIVIATATA